MRSIDGLNPLIGVLTLEDRGGDLFAPTDTQQPHDPSGMFGGVLAGQAMRAAAATAPDDMLPHVLQCVYLRRTDPATPYTYRVSREYDGRSYVARRVEAVQEDRVVFTSHVGFHRAEDGPDVQQAEASDLDTVPVERASRVPSRTVGLEFRNAQPDGQARPSRVWFRAERPVVDDAVLATCALAYASDMGNGLRLLPASRPGVRTATLNHSIWFHRPVVLDGWHLMDLVPRSVAAGRGLYDGTIFGPDGRLVASLAQESVFRLPRAD